ncbi:MAG: hypothetical protein HZB51_34275 [Chloroflexi bacterium]|nr:hypothetical protein [Chloroflexota bacterium]
MSTAGAIDFALGYFPMAKTFSEQVASIYFTFVALFRRQGAWNRTTLERIAALEKRVKQLENELEMTVLNIHNAVTEIEIEQERDE